MQREHWAELSQAISQVDARWKDSPRLTHPTSRIARVYLWASIHDCSINWACDAENWPPASRPDSLPDQSTMSRRTRTNSFEQFLSALGEHLAGRSSQSVLLKRMDGKPLPVASHSSDRNATWGRGAGQSCRGYKLHAIWGSRAMPEQWALTPLNVDERHMARRMLKRLKGSGYVLADTLYDGSDLHDLAAGRGHQLLCPRRKPSTGLGHHYQSPHRLRCLAMLEPPAACSDFGTTLYQLRPQIERDFGNLSSFGGGLGYLPAWARRIWRVRLWVWSKLLVNAARIRCLRRRHSA